MAVFLLFNFSFCQPLDLSLCSVMLKVSLIMCCVCARFSLVSLSRGHRSQNQCRMRPSVTTPCVPPSVDQECSAWGGGAAFLLTCKSQEVILTAFFLIIKLDSTLKMFSKESKMLQRSISFSNMVSSF